MVKLLFKSSHYYCLQICFETLLDVYIFSSWRWRGRSTRRSPSLSSQQRLRPWLSLSSWRNKWWLLHLLSCLLWSDFKTAFFLIKIQIENYLKPPFLIVSAGKWVRVDNIRFARQHKVFVMFWAFPRCLGALWIFSPSRAIFWGKWSIQSPIDALKWVQSGPKCLKLVYFTPVNCFGLIRNISVHHLRCLEISSSRILLFGDPEAVILTI